MNKQFDKFFSKSKNYAYYTMPALAISMERDTYTNKI